MQRKIDHAVADHLATDATSYNLAIEQTENEMLLLNVVRAMNHSPLYITDASKVTGTVKADLNIGLKIPLIHLNKANDFVASPTFDFSTSPSMDVNLLNSKDFMTGFLTPLPADRFAYYWNQGWPAEMLLYLLVLRAEQTDCDSPGSEVFCPPSRKAVRCEQPKPAEPQQPAEPAKLAESCTWSNHPNVNDANLGEISYFAKLVHGLVRRGRPIVEQVSEEKLIGPPIGCAQLSGKYLDALRAIASDDKLSLKVIDKQSGQCQLTRESKSYVLHPPGVPAKAGRVGFMATDSEKRTFQFTLRSPEGILYYLGELARVATNGERHQVLMIHPCDPAQCPDLPTEPLFVVAEGDNRECASLLKVKALDGSDYFVPGRSKGYTLTSTEQKKEPLLVDLDRILASCRSGRSMHALSLLSQVIGLQKTAADFSTTSTVKVVGQ